jgi:hypothetical protein
MPGAFRAMEGASAFRSRQRDAGALKKGLYLPGKHIPIVDNSILAEEQPDYVVMFAWHYRDEMIKSLRGSGVRSHLVQPLPELQIFAGDEGAK